MPETLVEPSARLVSSAGNILLRWSGADRWNDTLVQDLKYEWRLNGGDWVSDNRTDHTFTALKSGDYRFEVRAINRYGMTDATPEVHGFLVEAPWWQNPWVVGGTVVLLGLVGVQTGRVIRRDRRLRTDRRLA